VYWQAKLLNPEWDYRSLIRVLYNGGNESNLQTPATRNKILYEYVARFWEYAKEISGQNVGKQFVSRIFMTYDASGNIRENANLPPLTCRVNPDAELPTDSKTNLTTLNFLNVRAISGILIRRPTPDNGHIEVVGVRQLECNQEFYMFEIINTLQTTPELLQTVIAIVSETTRGEYEVQDPQLLLNVKSSHENELVAGTMIVAKQTVLSLPAIWQHIADLLTVCMNYYKLNSSLQYEPQSNGIGLIEKKITVAS
jgi:hypothetical protein